MLIIGRFANHPMPLDLFRFGEILGMFDYCLLFIPPMLYLWYWLSSRDPALLIIIPVA